MIRWVHYTDETRYAQLCAWVGEKIWGETRPFPMGVVMAVLSEGPPPRLEAAMVFHNFDPDAGVVEISGASENAHWLSRPVLQEMFGWPFDTLGFQAVVMRVDPDNRRLGRMLPTVGFKRYDIPRLRGRDKAEAIYVLTDDAWRASRFARRP